MMKKCKQCGGPRPSRKKAFCGVCAEQRHRQRMRECAAKRKKRPSGTCVHCKRGAVNRPRGLCWSCYYDQAIRVLYQPTSKFAKQGLGLGNTEPPAPTESTSAMPGTAEKIAILNARLEANIGLWHPHDAPFDRILSNC